MAKPSPEELRFRLKFRIVDMIGSIIHTIVPWGCAVLIAWFFERSVVSLAGQYTFAQIGVGFLGDFRISDSFAYIFGAGGIAYGIKRRKLYQDNIERTAQRIADYEKRLDERRSSSRLTPRGKTRPEDKQ
jgi:hypothetical protein